MGTCELTSLLPLEASSILVKYLQFESSAFLCLTVCRLSNELLKEVSNVSVTVCAWSFCLVIILVEKPELVNEFKSIQVSRENLEGCHLE